MKAKPRKSQKQRALGVIQNDAMEQSNDAGDGKLVSAPDLAASGAAAHSILSVKKKKLKAKKRRLGSFGFLKWKNVTPDNGIDLLLGSDEGGFMSLEEVDGSEYEAAISGQAFPADSPVEDLSVPEVSLEKESGRKKSKPLSEAAEVGPEVGATVKVKKGKKKKSSGDAVEVKQGEESGSLAVAVSVSRSEDCVKGEEGVKPPNKRERGRMKWEERRKLQASDPMAAEALVEQKKSEVPKRKKLNLRERKQLQREKKRLKQLALEGESNGDSAKEALKINDTCHENREQKRLKELDLEGEGNQDSAMEVDRKRFFFTEEEMEIEEVGKGVGVATRDAGRVDEGMEDGEEGGREDEELLMEKVEGWREMRLHPAIAKGIAELGFAEPTAIQRACIPAAAHQGKDVIGAAETGSGKTLAFGIPILQRLMMERDKDQRRAEKKAHRLGLPVEDFLPQKPEEEEPTEEEGGENGSSKNGVEEGGHLRALVITPTRELALQVCDHLKEVARFTGVRVVPIVGGMAQPKQQRLLRGKPEIVVGTPGRLWELMSQGETHLTQLEHISFFVLDEADRMVEKGHFQELQSIIDLLPATSRPQASIKPSSAADDEMPGEEEMDTGVRVAKKKRQTLLFSATLALPPGFRKKMKKLSGRDLKQKGGDASLAALVERAHINPNAAIVDLTTSAVVAEKLEQSVIQCMEDEKDQYLYYLLRMHPTRTLVFCTAISAVRRVLSILRLLQLPVWGLHAQMQQRQRLKAMDRFKASEEGVLVATDVAARGLDISGVRSVIHYQLPHVAEMYVHRCGRTARATSDGCSVALVSPSERAQFAALCRTLSLPDGVAPFPVKEAYIASVRKRVLLALKLDEALHAQSQAKAATSWVRKNAEELDIEIDDESMPSGSSKRSRGEEEETTGEEGTAVGKREEARVRSLQQELQSLLEQPLEPKAFSHRYIAGKEMTPTLVKQLRELQEQRKKNGVKSKPAKGKGRTEVMPTTPQAPVPVPTKSRLTVIGQDMVEALHALRAARKN